MLCDCCMSACLCRTAASEPGRTTKAERVANFRVQPLANLPVCFAIGETKQLSKL